MNTILSYHPNCAISEFNINDKFKHLVSQVRVKDCNGKPTVPQGARTCSVKPDPKGHAQITSTIKLKIKSLVLIISENLVIAI